jgi:hypothetical protein
MAKRTLVMNYKQLRERMSITLEKFGWKKFKKEDKTTWPDPGRADFTFRPVIFYVPSQRGKSGKVGTSTGVCAGRFIRSGYQAVDLFRDFAKRTFPT